MKFRQLLTASRRTFRANFVDVRDFRSDARTFAGRPGARTFGRSDDRTLGRPDARASGRPGVRTPALLFFQFLRPPRREAEPDRAVTGRATPALAAAAAKIAKNERKTTKKR